MTQSARTYCIWGNPDLPAEARGRQVIELTDAPTWFKEDFFARRKISAAPTGHQDDAINDTQRKMLSVLVHREQMNQPATPRAMLAAMAGIKATGGTYGTYLSRLRTAGYIEGGRDLSITDAGIAALGPVDDLPTGIELIEWYKANKLNATQGAMLDAIVQSHPNGVTRCVLASAVELESGGGTYGTYLSRMRQLGIIEGSGLLSLTDAVAQGL